jgi:hypothetical protein
MSRQIGSLIGFWVHASKTNALKSGTKHLIQCHCILPQYRNSEDPTFHQFVVFSILDEESDTIIPKFASCNNCGAVHKVIDICKSEIVTGRDEVVTQMTVDDFKFALPNDLYDLLLTYQKDIADFEHAQFILENKNWNDHIILTREEIDGIIQGKLVKFLASDRLRVESYIIRTET